MSVHIVWDWNGTLLNDLDLVVRSVSSSIERLGHRPITVDDYRDHFTRPVRKFYESLFDRSVGDMEWAALNKTFHELYQSGVDEAALAPDAVTVLEHATGKGWGQSLLSMSAEAHLIPTVRSHGIEHFFTLITGPEEPTGELKATFLEAHLDAQGVEPESVVVIGDTPDDHDAAVAVGARSILYDGGSHHRLILDAVGAPVAGTLVEAIALIEEEAAA